MTEEMMNTIERVKTMLQVEDIPSFKYIPALTKMSYYKLFGGSGNVYGSFGYYGIDEIRCAHCGKPVDLVGVVEVEDPNGELIQYCGSCVDKNDLNITWCYNCGGAYTMPLDRPNTGLCYSCMGGYSFGSAENEGYC